MTAQAVAGQLQVDPAKGLSAAEAQQRLQKYGPNKLAGKKKEPDWQAFLRQYKDFMQITLVAAALVSGLLIQDWGTARMLLILTVFNAVLSLKQESKAEASLAALEKMMKNIACVRRDGQAIEVDAEELVPGDIVLMEAGNRVPADGRLFVAATLETEEAALTGESVASPKETEAIAKPDVEKFLAQCARGSGVVLEAAIQGLVKRRRELQHGKDRIVGPISDVFRTFGGRSYAILDRAEDFYSRR